MKTILKISLLLTVLLSSCTQDETPSSTSLKVESLSWTPRVFILRNFLTENECDHLIDIAKDSLTRATVVDHVTGLNKIDDVRTSEGVFLKKDLSDVIVKDIENRISLITMIPPENGESIQVLHYAPGQEFKPHYDYFNLKTTGGIANFHQGGQRVASFLMYLNTPEEGGETVFPKLDIAVVPKKGDALLFFDCCLDGRTDPLTFHGGLPVLKGEKWLATKWFRQNTYH